MRQVFVSHTHEDEDFCDAFDRVCARVGIKAFRSEFESIPLPAWKTIKDAMNNSIALFFLVGKELVENQELKEEGWEFTQNWIAYEVGLACQKGIDVWVVCDNVDVNFPIPYVNNYLIVDLEEREAFDYMRFVLESYRDGYDFPYPHAHTDGYSAANICPDCRNEFNLHVKLKPNTVIRCPQCLRALVYPDGFPLYNIYEDFPEDNTYEEES